MANHTVHKTRFAELGYWKIEDGCWSVVDLTDGKTAQVGQHYPTKETLLANLENYASDYGCALAKPAQPLFRQHLPPCNFLKAAKDQGPCNCEAIAATFFAPSLTSGERHGRDGARALGLDPDKKSMELVQAARIFRDAIANIDFSPLPGVYDTIPWDLIDNALDVDEKTPMEEKAAVVDFSNTYWNHKGKYPEINAVLEKLIPAKGEVLNPDHKALERFRSASNCYHDLYNNGLCNRKAEFRKVFGFASGHTYGDRLTQALVDKTEAAMNAIILTAAGEQGIAVHPALLNSGLHGRIDSLNAMMTEIAKKHFRIETLETRRGDSSDFHDVAVWDIKDALMDAYNAGVKAATDVVRVSRSEVIQEVCDRLNGVVKAAKTEMLNRQLRDSVAEDALGPMPWCAACEGYHYATAPGCFKGTERDKTQPFKGHAFNSRGERVAVTVPEKE